MTSDMSNEIAADYAAGMAYNDIVTKYRCGWAKVNRAIAEAGVARRGNRPRKPVKMNPGKAADIVADYLRDPNIQRCAARMRVGKVSVRRVIDEAGVRTKPVPVRSDTSERDRVIADSIRAGKPVSEVLRAMGVGHETIRVACKAHGVKLRKSTTEKHREQLRRMEAVTTEQWNAWEREKATLGKVSKILGVCDQVLSRWCRDNDHKFWSGSGRMSNEEQAAAARRRAQFTTEAPVEPTRFDYMVLCDREFALPHFLRKAPEMLKRIEANEARERAKGPRRQMV